MKSNKKSNQIK